MQALDLTKLKGQYIVLDPPVLSVYASHDGRPERREARHWPFLVTDALADMFAGGNTTTGHRLDAQRSEVRGISGDLDAPPNYWRPLTVHLNAQVCWNNIDLWREPLPQHPLFKRSYARRARIRRRAGR